MQHQPNKFHELVKRLESQASTVISILILIEDPDIGINLIEFLEEVKFVDDEPIEVVVQTNGDTVLLKRQLRSILKVFVSWESQKLIERYCASPLEFSLPSNFDVEATPERTLESACAYQGNLEWMALRAIAHRLPLGLKLIKNIASYYQNPKITQERLLKYGDELYSRYQSNYSLGSRTSSPRPDPFIKP